MLNGLEEKWERLQTGLGRRLFRGNTPIAYILALALVGLALAIRLLVAPVEDGFQFVAFFPAVAMAALIGGFFPGALAILASVFLVSWILFPPYWEFGIDDGSNELWSGLLFLIGGFIIAISIDALHRYRRNFEADLLVSQQTAQAMKVLLEREEESSRQLSQYAAIVQSSDDAIISKSSEGTILSWNPGAEKIFGYSAQEAIGQPVRFLLPENRQQEEQEIIARLRCGERIAHFETIRRSKSGKLLDISVTYSLLKDLQGQIIGFAKVARDITQTKDALRQLDTFFDLSRDLMCIASADGYFKRVNRAFSVILGWSEAEMLASPYLDLVHPDDVGATQGAVEQQVVRGEAVLNFESRFRHKQGGWRLLSWSSVPGKDGMMFTTARDVTEQHAQSEALRASSEKIRMILNAVGEGIYGIDCEGKITFSNPEMRFLLGWTEEELTGQVAHTLIHHTRPDGTPYPMEECSIHLTLRDGLMRHNEEDMFWRKDGSSFSVAYTSTALRSDIGELVGCIVSFRDISVRKQAQAMLAHAKERAEQADRTKSSFLASMSHEIRTPLGGMLGMLELLAMTSLDEEQMATLETARASGRGMLRIVNDILDWSKIEEGKLEIALQPTSLEQLLSEVVNTYSRVASSKSLNLWRHIDTRLTTPYLLDPLRVSQVLNNFVSNAIKFTSRGEIELRADLLEACAEGDRIHFSVRDTGIGISSEEQSRLFQTYQQANAETARMYGGTGLGLAICQRLAKMMNGETTLRSEPGRGSVFGLILCLPRADAAVRMPSNAQINEVQQRSVRPLFASEQDAPLVLVVDDHPTNRELLARQIKLLGLRSKTAEHGRAGLALWRDGRFDMIITDCHMPVMDGYEMTRSIRALEAVNARARTPIIAWTANVLSEERESCANAGMDELLVKPVNLDQLREMLNRWLGGDVIQRAPAAAIVSAPAPISSPIDYAMLDQIMTDRNEQAHLLQEFLAHVRQDRGILREQLEQGLRAQAQSTAHRMKGSCRMVGAVNLGDRCAEIELAAKNGELDSARATLGGLDAALAELTAFVAPA